MVRSLSKWTFATILLGMGITWSSTANLCFGQGAISPGTTVSIQESGKTLRCQVMSSWRLANGDLAFKAKVQASGEMLTVVQPRGSTSATGTPLPMRIWHWGVRTSAPAGCPVEPGTYTAKAPAPSAPAQSAPPRQAPPVSTAQPANQSWNSPRILSESDATVVQVSKDPVLPKGTKIVSQPVCRHGKTNCPICAPESYIYRSDQFEQAPESQPAARNVSMQPPVVQEGMPVDPRVNNLRPQISASTEPLPPAAKSTQPPPLYTATNQPTTAKPKSADGYYVKIPASPTAPDKDMSSYLKTGGAAQNKTGPRTSAHGYETIARPALNWTNTPNSPTAKPQTATAPAQAPVQTTANVPQPLTEPRINQTTKAPTMMERWRGMFGGTQTAEKPSTGTNAPGQPLPTPNLNAAAKTVVPNQIKAPTGVETKPAAKNLLLPPVPTETAKPALARTTIEKPIAAPVTTPKEPTAAVAKNKDPLAWQTLPPGNAASTAPAVPQVELPLVPPTAVVNATRPTVMDVVSPPQFTAPVVEPPAASTATAQSTTPAKVDQKPVAAPHQVANHAAPPPKTTNAGATTLLKDITIPPSLPQPTADNRKPPSTGAASLVKDVTIPPALPHVTTDNRKIPGDPAKKLAYDTPPVIAGKTDAGKTRDEHAGPLARLFGYRGGAHESKKDSLPPASSDRQIADATPRMKPLAPDMPKSNLRIPDYSGIGATPVDLFEANKVMTGTQMPALDRATAGLPNKSMPTTLGNSAAMPMSTAPVDVSKAAIPSVAVSTASTPKSGSLNDIFESIKGDKTAALNRSAAPVVAQNKAPEPMTPLPSWPGSPAAANAAPEPASIAQTTVPAKSTATPSAPLNFTEPPALPKALTQATDLAALPPIEKEKPAAKKPNELPKALTDLEDVPSTLAQAPKLPEVKDSTRRAGPALPQDDTSGNLVDRFQEIFGTKPAAKVADAGPKIAQFPTGIPATDLPPSTPKASPLDALKEDRDIVATAAKKTEPQEDLKPAVWRDLMTPQKDDIKPAVHAEPTATLPEAVKTVSAEAVMAKEHGRTPFSTALANGDTAAPKKLAAAAEKKPAPRVMEIEKSNFTPISPKRTAQAVEKPEPEAPQPEAPKPAPEPETDWRNSWGKATASKTPLPGKSTLEQPRRLDEKLQDAQPLSRTENPHYPDPLMNPEQFTPHKVGFNSGVQAAGYQNMANDHGVRPATLPFSAPPEGDMGLQQVSHESAAATPPAPYMIAANGNKSSTFHAAPKKGLLNRMRNNADAVSQAQQAGAPQPEQIQQMPPGAGSVAAAGNGFAPKYVPVPLMTMPNPVRPPSPPLPNLPEPPDPASYVNAFSSAPPPVQRQQNGPAFNAFPQGMPPQLPPGYQGYPQPYGQMPMQQMPMQQMPQMPMQQMPMMPMQQMPMNPQMMGQMPMNPQMMQAAYQQGYPQQPYAMPPNYPQRPTLQYNVPTNYSGPMPPNHAEQLQQVQQIQMQQMQMQQLQQMQMMQQMTPNNAPNNAMDRPGQAQASGAGNCAEHITVMQSSPYPAQREWAANNLTTFDWQKQPEILQALLTSAQNDPAPSVRAAAIYHIARKGVTSPAVISAFEALKNDVDPRVRHQATQALGQMQTLEAAPQSGITQAN